MLTKYLLEAQYRLACAVAPKNGNPRMDGSVYNGKSKLRVLLGDDIADAVKGRVVIDFGCGSGEQVVEAAMLGAARAIGVDIQLDLLERARERADAAGVGDRCEFGPTTDHPADVVISLDSFEHFADPARMLRLMYDLLAPGGEVWTCFGPTWYHPLGGHMFSIFPWAHLLLAERALIRWRSTVRSDGATRFEEVAGGLNRMTIGRFERLVAESPFDLVRLEPVPIRRLQPVHSRLTREWTTAVVRCRLRKPAGRPAAATADARAATRV